MISNSDYLTELRLSERTTKLVTKLEFDLWIQIKLLVAMGNCNLYMYRGYREYRDQY